MQELLKIMRRLRAPDGCPWDLQQTHESLRTYLLEEAAEAVDAITEGKSDEIVEELGDVLLQIAFHSVIAEQANSFSYSDIEHAIVAKLIRRHPHVFADIKVESADEVVANWQEIKSTEKTKKSPLDSVPKSLTSLMRAAELSKKLAWEVPSKADLQEKTEALTATDEDIGKLLLAIASFSKANGINPEIALREAILSKTSLE